MIIRTFNLPDGRVLQYHEFTESRVDNSNKKIKYLTQSRETETSPDYVNLYVETQFTEWNQELVSYEAGADAITNGNLFIWEDNVNSNVKTLEELKADKRKDIDDWRAEERYSNTVVAVDGIDYIWQSDSDSQDLISNAVSFAISGIAPPPPIWRTFDDIDVPVTLDDIKNIAGAMAQKTSIAFYRSFQLKQLVEAATTPEQVAEITWSTEI